MKKEVVVLLAAIVVLSGWASFAQTDNPEYVGKPTIFWHQGEWQTYKDGVWTPYGKTAANPKNTRRSHDSEATHLRQNRVHRRGGSQFATEFKTTEIGKLTDRADQPTSGMGQTTIGIGQNNISMGQWNGIGEPNIAIGQRNGIGETRIGIGQPTIGIGEPNGIGQTTIGIGQRNGIGQNNTAMGPPNMGIGPPNIAIGQPNGIGQTTIGIGKPMGSPSQPQISRRRSGD